MATKIKTLDIAIAEAERFLSAAKSFRKGSQQYGDTKNPWLEGGALAAYTKRASMDLSRALAKIRAGDPL